LEDNFLGRCNCGGWLVASTDGQCECDNCSAVFNFIDWRSDPSSSFIYSEDGFEDETFEDERFDGCSYDTES